MDLPDTSFLFSLQTITSSKHRFLNFFCVSGTHWGLAPSLCSRFPTLHWISSVALPPFATQSMYTHSRCPGHVTTSSPGYKEGGLRSQTWPSPQPLGVRLTHRDVHGGIDDEILAKGRKFP